MQELTRLSEVVVKAMLDVWYRWCCKQEDVCVCAMVEGGEDGLSCSEMSFDSLMDLHREATRRVLERGEARSL